MYGPCNVTRLESTLKLSVPHLKMFAHTVVPGKTCYLNVSSTIIIVRTCSKEGAKCISVNIGGQICSTDAFCTKLSYMCRKYTLHVKL